MSARSPAVALERFWYSFPKWVVAAGMERKRNEGEAPSAVRQFVVDNLVFLFWSSILSTRVKHIILFNDKRDLRQRHQVTFGIADVRRAYNFDLCLPACDNLSWNVL
jgi:hypothetical protein